MSSAKTPKSLRKTIAKSKLDVEITGVAIACLAAAGSVTNAEAQQATGSTLPAVTVDAPTQRARPVVAQKPTAARVAARKTVRRNATRQAARPTSTPASAAPATNLPTLARAPGANPYADPAAPYKVDHLSSSKFTEPVVNQPRSITVLTKENLDDQNATSLRQIGRTTAGVTLGSGEGGNAFGDRFFIRGFDARNDVFVDGVRDPGVSIRENFFTEQVEILRGPASSFAGRGTTGGAINIVTKKAGDQDFYRAESTLGSDQTKRLTIDVNKAISPILDVRVNGLIQGANVAGRDFTTDDRNGVAGALTFRPFSNFTLTADYTHTYLSGIPDFGVPYDLQTNRPVTEGIVPRNTYYGITNRDFTKTTQNLGTVNAEYKVNSWLTLENKFRQGYSILNYVGTIPENPSGAGTPAVFISTPTSFSGYTQLNAQSRFQTVAVLADQPQATAKFDTGPIRHTAILGAEFSGERAGIQGYNGLTSEVTTGVPFVSGVSPITSVYSPINGLGNPGTLTLSGNPQIYHVDTNAVYLMDTANYNDFIILNGGVRFDDYKITSSNYTSSQTAHSGIPSYNVGLVIKPMPIGSIYAAYATAAEPVGAELDATASAYGGLSPTQASSQVFGPQRSEATEVGTKWELFDRHLLATAAAFQTDVQNARETAPTGTPGYASGTIVAGAAYRIQGLDFELAGKITDKWSVSGGLVLMKSAIVQSIVPHNVGLQLANIANRSFNLLTKYQITDAWELGGQAVYASQIYGGSLLVANGGVSYAAAPSPTVLPSHWRFDTFAEAKIGPYSTLKLYVENVFNRTYYDSIYQSSVPFIKVAPGRTVSLVATVKF